MPEHVLKIVSEIVEAENAGLVVETPVFIIGESTTGTNNTIYKINKASDLTALGDGKLVRDIKILQRYGLKNIFAVKVDSGASYDTNLVGGTSPTNTGLELANEVFSNHKKSVQFIIVPRSTTVVVEKAIEIANKIDAFVYVDLPTLTTLTTATTERAKTTGIGTKTARLITCMPQPMVGSDIESLAVHAVGAAGLVSYSKGFGFSTSNTKLLKIDGVESGFTFSYKDTTADNHRLENLGILTLNSREDGYYLWGNRNGLYQENTNESIDTYIVINRIKQILNNEIEKVTQKYIDRPCNFAEAKLLEFAINNVINSNVIKGNLGANSKAEYDASESDFTLRSLVYKIKISSNLPTEIIELNLTYTVSF